MAWGGFFVFCKNPTNGVHGNYPAMGWMCKRPCGVHGNYPAISWMYKRPYGVHGNYPTIG